MSQENRPQDGRKRLRAGLDEAADGIRTHDLPHGKRAGRPQSRRRARLYRASSVGAQPSSAGG
jgi:hypothetical protein